MTVFETIAALITLAALASYVNHRFFRLPTTIGLMSVALIGSIALVALDKLNILQVDQAAHFIATINFDEVLLHGMLSFLLFAGALHVDIALLRSAKMSVAVLATAGVVIATFVTGTLFWYGVNWLGFNLPYLYALLFGALIAPTDPIAVLGILKQVGAPKDLEIKIAGESLFNDGVGVVVFVTILGIATGQSSADFGHISLFLVEEVVGGVGMGLILGWVTFRLLRSVDAYQVEVLLTLALAAGGYALAEAVHVSAPITMVVAGLLIGNHGRAFAMSKKTREHIDTFWELIDEILNAILFMLIGMEIIALTLSQTHLLAGVLAIGAVLIGRFVSVGLPVSLMRFKETFQPGTIKILTWGGLRGGISIALALSLPPGKEREIILAATYLSVIFSVLVQGLTFGRVIRSLTGSQR